MSNSKNQSFMDENRLFNSFIAGQPANPNQYDRHAFVKYAIEALRNGNDLDSERLRQMRENGIPEGMIDYYLEAFLWVEHSYQILCKEK